jgi:hypothetical protein
MQMALPNWRVGARPGNTGPTLTHCRRQPPAPADQESMLNCPVTSARKQPFRAHSRHFARHLAIALLLTTTNLILSVQAPAQVPSGTEKVGVLYVIHGAGRTQHLSQFFDAAIQMASYDPNSSTYRNTIWQPENWPKVVPLADKARVASMLGLYRRSGFEFTRLGNLQPAIQITEARVASLSRELQRLDATKRREFLVDWVAWITGSDDMEHLPYPRFIYNRDGASEVPMRYCGGPGDGGAPPDGRWPQCDPERYNVDGPMDRLLAAGVDRVVLVDTTVGGPRFSKTLDVQQMLRRARDAVLAGSERKVPITWVNDPTGLIAASYPTQPEGWTASMGLPLVDPKVPLEGRGNPVTDDPRFARIWARGISRAMSDSVAPAETGVLFMAHGIYAGNEAFDPKISDTITLHKNLQATLLEQFPDLRAENIVGGWEGIRQEVDGMLQRTRAMRGEDLGHAYLYESDGTMPPGKWGLRYWEALERLKAQGVRHIVVAFTQAINTTTVTQVGLPNQIGKEIGYRNFRPIPDLAIPWWPGYDSPFADFWPAGAQLLCQNGTGTGGNADAHECCYELAGCSRGRDYPENRQTPLDKPMSRVDPALVFDVPPFGHLGYDPAKGPPDTNSPVQDQYTGTWSVSVPMDDDPDLARFLAELVLASQER